jgi:hypothetical protein
MRRHYCRVISVINYSYYRPASCCIGCDSEVIEKAVLMTENHSHRNDGGNYEQYSEITTIFTRKLATESEEFGLREGIQSGIMKLWSS